MKIHELTETIASMSELAAVVPEINQHCDNLRQARVTVDPNKQEITLHSEFQQQPLQVTYHLRTEDPAAFRRQLAAALKSNSGGDTVVRDAVGSINNSVLRQHALRFLTNPRRWQRTQCRLAGQLLPRF